MSKNVKKWYSAGRSTGWSKDDAMDTRRRRVLKSRHGDTLAAYHAMDGLAKVSKDPATASKARADAEYFRKLHNKRK
jgi:hypothetical protein